MSNAEYNESQFDEIVERADSHMECTDYHEAAECGRDRDHLIKMVRALVKAYGDGDFCSGCPLFGDSGCEAGVSLDIDRCEKTITAWADKQAGGEG